MASSKASSHRRATDHVGWSAIGGHAGARSHGRVVVSTAPTTTATATSAATPTRIRVRLAIEGVAFNCAGKTMSASARRPSACFGDASLHDRELVRGDVEPWAGLASRPQNADVRASRIAEAEMDPTELSSGVASADRELASRDPIADADLGPGADRVRVRPGLRDAQREPVAHRARMGCVAGTDVAPDPHRRAVVDLNEVEHPIEVEVGERRPSPSIERDDAGRVGGLVKCSVLLSDEKVARVLLRVLDLVGDVALRYEKIDEAVVVHVRELAVPRGRWPRIAAGEWLGRVHPAPEADVAIGRLGRTQRESLQSIVGLAREKDLRITVAGQVVARDAHPLYLYGHPSIVRGVQRRRLTRRDAPELLLTLGRQVVVLVVAHSKIDSAGPTPVAEEHGERAPARL